MTFQNSRISRLCVANLFTADERKNGHKQRSNLQGTMKRATRFMTRCLHTAVLRCPLLWSSGQRSWPQIQRSGFNSGRYQIFCEVVGLERGPLSLVSTIEELLERKSNGSGIESREYGRRDPSRRPRGILYPQKLEITSPTSGGRAMGTVRSRTQATEFSFS
jgi:hypothetical protein